MKATRIILLFLLAAMHVNAQLKPFDDQGKWGFKDVSGAIVVPAIYSSVDVFNAEGFALVANKENGVKKYGMIDKAGKLIIPAEYIKLSRYVSNDMIWASPDGKSYGYLNKSGQVVVPFKYESAEIFQEGLGAVSQNAKFGFIDTRGAVKIPLIYDRVSGFSNGLSLVTLNNKRGFIDNNGKRVTEMKYDDISFGHMAAQLYGARIGDKSAILNRQGLEITPFVFDEVRPNFDSKRNFIAVRKNWQWGLVDLSGSTIIPTIYADIDILTDNLINVKKDGKWGIINTKGKVILPFASEEQAKISSYLVPQGTFIQDNARKSFVLDGDGIKLTKYAHIDEEVDGRRAVYYNYKVGFIDRKGQEIIPIKYDSVGRFDKGLVAVALGGKFGFVDTMGRERTPVKYDYVGPFTEGLSMVYQNNKCGFIDATGAEIIPLQYEGAASFSEGLAAVVVNKKVGFINRLGRMIIEPEYDGLVQNFQYGKAVVVKDGKEVVIGKTGRPVQ